MPSDNEITDYFKHLRMVHFTLVVTSIAFLVSATSVSTIHDRALQQISDIQDALVQLDREDIVQALVGENEAGSKFEEQLKKVLMESEEPIYGDSAPPFLGELESEELGEMKLDVAWFNRFHEQVGNLIQEEPLEELEDWEIQEYEYEDHLPKTLFAKHGILMCIFLRSVDT